MCYVTKHAAERYQQRAERVDLPTAYERLQACAKVVDLAASFGCSSIKLGNGARLKLDGDIITTVYPKFGSECW